ncbi:LysR family transcriptional regulator [Sodalis ligni]|jgi:DNA-binding transcriptional LysR family regulator|uniref:DNA-binding transcriptional LysR family regulator n=1 Tax=Sodalis ligni TaxID=2697027 RepID=A0A4V2Q2J9_9GAMM|nr:LysR family transcriptional regulator [Sodalis ligni]TCL03128.1 DNA-binding transcriptional LysR family regulator [Sodalis ligni]
MESLTGLNAFVHAAELRSYVGAARVLGISSSAVAKSVARLEDDLGVRLFHRTTRSIGLTEEGAVFYEHCKRILDDFNDARAMISASRVRPKGRLRISVPHIVGHNLLMPLLPAFLQQFPEIELDIDFEDRVVDLIGEGIDVAVRSGELADTRLIGHRLGEQHFVVCGSNNYFERYSRPETPADLIRHVCIHFKYPSSGRLAPWSFRSPHTSLSLPESLIFSNTNAGLRAAIDGLGLAHLPVYIAEPAIKIGLIQPVLTKFMVPRGSLSLIWPSNRHLSPKVRTFVDFVITELRANPAIFEAKAV